MSDFDVIVVGAGPAGSAAAIVAARAGKRVALIERGPFPGSKNMYGGVVYGRILDDLIPKWWEQAPIQRWVVRRGTMLATATQSLTVDVRSTAWGQAPYNGATALRPDFDAWLAEHAVAAGATLVCSTTVTALLKDGNQVVGVRTDRPDGELTAKVVIACDGVNSFLAKEAGLYPNFHADHFTLGVKEVLKFDKKTIDQRFNVRGLEGVDYEIVGVTGGVPGGGFIYTNLESVAVGVVLKLPDLAASKRRPEAIIAEMKEHPAIAALVEGGELIEYSAHLIPEAGFDAMPEIVGDGLLVAGDAAGLCLAAGIWLEGVNFAIGSGVAAARAAVRAVGSGDASSAGLASYRATLESNFVLKDHRKLRRVPELLMSDRFQRRYPDVACGIAEQMFTVRNPAPKRGVRAIAQQELKRAGVRMRDVPKDAWAAMRSFG